MDKKPEDQKIENEDIQSSNGNFYFLIPTLGFKEVCLSFLHGDYLTP